MGDFNYRQIGWEHGIVEGPEDSDASRFFQATQDAFLYQHVLFPTRYREGCVSSTLDLVFTDEEHMVEDLVCGEPLGKSDHCVLTWKLCYDNDITKKEATTEELPKLNYRKGDYEAMRENFSLIDWTELNGLGVEETWSRIKDEIYSNIQKFVPKHKKRKAKSAAAPWWSNQLQKEVKAKYKLWKDYTAAKTTESYRKYATQRNNTTAKIRNARQEYEAKIIEGLKIEPKRLFSYVRLQQKVKPSIGSLEEESGKLTETDKEAAEVLQSFFKSVFVKEDNGKMPHFSDLISKERCLCDITLNVQIITEELKALNAEKAAGPDRIPTVVLKSCAEQLAVPLLILFQKTFEEGHLPIDWKAAKITPIFKKGSKKVAGNYRPVSLTSQPCKILERIIRKQVVNHLEDNELLSKHQHGFTRKRSCQTNLLETLEEWTKALDEGYSLDAIYLDYSKAFDTVPHRRLISKLNGYGVKGKVLLWIQDFLTDRQQQVVIGSSESSWGKVTSGVPQGSVLGPILFLLYVNELPSIVNCDITMFADDTKIYRTLRSSSDVQVLQKDLDALDKWSECWLLKFNTSKCKVMHLGPSNPKLDYTMQDGTGPQVLGETTIEKDLGVHIVNNLKPTYHCKKAANKAMTALKLVKIAFDRLTKTNFKLLYTTYVRPHLDYCIQAMGPYMVQDFKALERVQRRATKLVPEIRNLPYEERLKRLNLISMEERVLRGDLIETYKILTGKLNIDHEQFFQVNHNERTRGHHLKLVKRRGVHQARMKFFSNRVVTPWNNLPQEVVLAESTNSFKNRLDKHWQK